MKRGSIVMVLAVLVSSCPLLAATAYFTTTPNSDYATASNWSTSLIPGDGNNDEPRIGQSNTASAVYNTATGYTTTTRFLIGYQSGGNGSLTMNAGAGTLTFGGNNFGSANYVGVDRGTGTLTMNAGTITLTGAAGLNIGCNAATATGTVTVNTGATINVGSRALIGANNTANFGTLTLNGGTVNVGTGGAVGLGGDQYGVLRVGTGTTSLNLNGGLLSLYSFQSDSTDAAKTLVNFNGATVQARGDNAIFFTNSAGTGVGTYTTRVQAGGAIFDTNGYNIGVGTALVADTGSPGGGLTKLGAGTLTLSGANAYTGNTVVRSGTLRVTGSMTGSASGTRFIVGGGAGNNGSMIFDMGAGAATFYANGYSNSCDIGENGGTGSLTLDSGTLNVLTSGSNGSIRLGTNGAANGSLTVNGGALNVPGRILMAANNASSVAALTLNDGEINLGAPGQGSYSDPGLGLLWTGTGTSTINLNGGTLSLYAFHSTATGTVNVNLDGGTIRARNNNTSFTNIANMNLNVLGGGATLDTAGYNITVSRPLLGSAGDGGLTKTGDGTLTLTGSSTYTGQTTVSQGVLEFTGGGSAYSGGTAVGQIVVESNGTLRFARHDTFGNASANPQVTITVNGGTVTNSAGWFTPLGPVVLNEGTIAANAGHSTWDSFLFRNTVTTVAAANPSYLTSSGSNSSFHLNSTGTTFNVADGAAASDLIVSGVLEDYYPGTAGGLVKSGAGTMVLSGANTFAGNVQVTGGTLIDTVPANNTSPTATGLGNMTVGGRTVTVSNGGTLVFDASDAMGSYQYKTPVTLIADGGTITNGSGRFMSIGDVTLRNGGTLNADSGAAAGYQAFNLRGTITVDGTSGSFITATGTTNAGIHLGGTTIPSTTFNVASTGDPTADLIVSASLLDEVYNTGGLIKTGAGKMVLSGASTYAGSTLVQNGTLNVAASGSLTGAGLINATGGGVLTIDGTVTQADGQIFSVGTGIAGTTGTVIVNPGGVLNIGNGGSATLIGGSTTNNGQYGRGIFTVAGGTVNVGAPGPGGNPNDAARLWLNPYGNGGATTLNLDAGTLSTARPISDGSSGSAINFNGGTLQAAASIDLLPNSGVTANVNAGGLVVDTQGYTATISKALSHGTGSPDGGLTKLGTGTLYITASNAYTGVTTIDQGTLIFSGNGRTLAGNSVVINNGGTLTFGRNDTWGNAATTTSAAVTVNAGGTLSPGGYFQTLWNASMNGGTILLNGGVNTTYPTFQLAGTFTVGGTTPSTINVGSGSNNMINITGNGNNTLTMDVADATSSPAADLTINAVLQNSPYGGNLTKTGAGTLRLNATNTYTGLTDIRAGTIEVASVTNGGTTGPLGSNNSIAMGGAATMGTLAFTGAGGSTNRSITLAAGGGAVDVAAGGELLLTGPISGSGTRTMPAAARLWLDASDTSTLYQTADTSTPVTASGQSVGYWADKSGMSNQATQSDAARRPVYTTTGTTINGNPVLLFDGVNDRIVSALDTNSSVLPDFSLFIAYRQVADTTNSGLWGQDNGSWDRFQLLNFSAGGAPTGYGISNGSGWTGVKGMHTTDPLVYAALIRQGLTNGSAVYINDLADASNGLPAFTCTTGSGHANMSLGSISTSTENYFGNIQIGEVIAYGRALSDMERANIDAYLAVKWGLVNPLPSTGDIIVGTEVATPATLDVTNLPAGLVLQPGQTLRGFGTVIGSTTALPGATVSPGLSAGTLHTGDMTLAPDSFFDVELAPEAWDMLDVAGLVSMDGANLVLDVTGSFASYGGSQYMIVSNDSSDPVIGIFDGLPEGARFEAGGAQFAITYVGGTMENDVVLTAVPEPASLALLTLAVGGLGGYIRRRRTA
ncbi:MAG: Autotransporter-associated beta strand repeat protein [Planctomycetes bacterium ADurb.Bin126]|nr:MAG: Autotransporter-associated beta strand repeat protein [Planctomycetes bacterium ADurb.Bin126]